MWFVTWDRPEYREWAKAVDGGYQLVILRKEAEDKFLCVKARLDMGTTGLPAFVTEEEQRVSSESGAQNIIDAWKK